MSPFVVSPAAPHELLPACRLLFAATHAEHSRDRLLADGRASALFVARDAGGRLHAAALVEALPGAMGVAWAPRGDSRDAIDAVTVAACAWLRERRVKVCQAFAAASEREEMAPLERSGFRHATQLVFLRGDLPPECEPTRRLSFATARPPFSEEFAATLLATHAGTLDCPELNATRTPAEVLAGFAASPAVEWHLASLSGERVGVVVLEYDPDRGAADLTYLGVVPAARGRKLGAELLRFVVADASRAGVPVLTVSVDARNAPATKLYARHGFAEYDRREVWLATWPA